MTLRDIRNLRRGRRLRIELLFDRKARREAAGRHLVYTADELCLDLWLVRASPASQAVLQGQLSHLANPLEPVTGIPVLLTSGESLLAETASDRLGEFELEYVPCGAMALCVALADGRLIEVPMT